MTVLRSSVAGLAIAAALALSPPARGQEPDAVEVPLELLAPPAEPAAPADRGPLAAPVVAPGETAEPTGSAAAPDAAAAGTAREGIEVAPLDALDPAAIGILGPEEGGFGLDMWAGTPRHLVESLLPRLPVGAASPAMHDLARRLLLSEALLPAGEAREVNLLGVRIERLRAAGELAAAAALIARAPESAVEPDFRRDQVDALWLAGDRAQACAIVAASGLRDRYWLRSRAVCQALAGDPDEGRLTLALIDELGYGDPPFAALMAALVGDGAAELASVPEPAAAATAAAAAADVALPDLAVNGAEPALLVAWANLSEASADARLGAAERIAALGVIDGAALAAAYAAVGFAPEELSGGTARIDAGPRGTALLYQVVRAESDGFRRAEGLRQALDLAGRRGLFLPVARAFAPVLAALQPTPALAPYAEALAPALIVSGRAGLARMWLDMAERELGRTALWPLLAVALGPDQEAWSVAGFAAWAATLGEERARHQAVVLAVLEAEGHVVPAGTWDGLIGDAPLEAIPFALLRGLDVAATSGRRGAVVLLGLVALGEAGPAGANAASMNAVIKALRQSDLAAEARALAVEAVLAHIR